MLFQSKTKGETRESVSRREASTEEPDNSCSVLKVRLVKREI
jgi:hypothetical protein